MAKTLVRHAHALGYCVLACTIAIEMHDALKVVGNVYILCTVLLTFAQKPPV